MKTLAGVTYAEPSDATTFRALAAEFGLSPAEARTALELGPDHLDDQPLTPVTATVYRLVLRSAS
jgi:hypothetical protein